MSEAPRYGSIKTNPPRKDSVPRRPSPLALQLLEAGARPRKSIDLSAPWPSGQGHSERAREREREREKGPACESECGGVRVCE